MCSVLIWKGEITGCFLGQRGRTDDVLSVLRTDRSESLSLVSFFRRRGRLG